MKSLLSVLFTGFFATAILAADFASAAEKPNFVFIVADDLGYADIGVHGCKDIPTPNIDALAASGVRFTNGYSNHSVCSPMRAGFLTGRYQHRFGYEANVPYDKLNPHLGLPDDVVTVPQRMKKAGYSTAAIGKWHLGAHHSKHPNRRGFDYFYGFLGGGHDYFKTDLASGAGEGYTDSLMSNGRPEALDGYLTTRLTEKAVEWIRKSKGEEFYLYLAYNAPHGPLQAPAETIAKFASISDPKRRTYAAMVSELDKGVGEILKALDAAGIRSNTIVAFLSDNGGPGPVNGSTNTPLRGFKNSFFEGGIRVPFLISWPGKFPAGKTDDRPVIALDLPVTALHLAGAPLDGQPLDGRNLAPFLTDPENSGPIHEALFWRTTLSKRRDLAVRTGDIKLVSNGTEEFVFNLRDDLAESRPLPVASAATARALWETWNAGNIPPRFLGFGSYHGRMAQLYQQLQQQTEKMYAK